VAEEGTPEKAENRSTEPKKLKGKRIGAYALVEHLASGGMAEIFLARHEAEGGFAKEMVLKILQGRYADHPDVVGMFLDEARIGARLNHSNIVDVYDVGEEDGLRYIAMEHIAGKTLTDVVRRGIEISNPLPLDHAAYLMAETAAGLAYMHDGTDFHGRRFGIIHRDISPSNLIISFSGQIKIIDFGIAREDSAAESESGARPGKVSYMSPEQVQGAPLDGRSDIFSLGTILYEITLGRRLWRGPKEVVMRRIVEEKPPPPTYVNRSYPPALELIVLRALEKRPENRYASAGDLFRELEGYLVATGARTRNHQIADYLHDLFAKDAVVSEMGVRRARAFDDEDQGDDDLDFDRPNQGAGKALADALRSSNPYAPPTPGKDERSQLEPVPVPVPTRRSLPAPMSLALPADESPVTQRRRSGLVATPLSPPPEPLPRRRRLGWLVGLVLASAAAVGLLVALTHA
jgi:serine/threonine-protein kinase